MGDLSEFPLKYKLFLKAYPWRRVDPVPWTPLQKPLKDCRLVLVSSAGFIQPGQAPFDESIRGGDYSFREIACDTDVAALMDTHRSDLFDHSGLRQDPNLAFPLDRLRELVKRGRIGSLNHRHLSFMGSITAPGRLIKKTLPGVTNLLKTDAVDAALLIPVWPICNQTVCLIAAEIERHSIATVTLQSLRSVVEKIRPPRALVVPFRHGFPLDKPDDPERQHAVIEAALRMLEDPGLQPPAIVDYEPEKGK